MATLLALVGAVSLTLALAVERPAMLRFARNGRPVSGRVSRSAPSEARNGDKRHRNRSEIRVNDPELGPQTIEVYGDWAIGQRIPVLCVTADSRCLSVDDVRTRLDMWPFTPLMLSGGISIVLASISGLAALFHRRDRPQRRALPEQA